MVYISRGGLDDQVTVTCLLGAKVPNTNLVMEASRSDAESIARSEMERGSCVTIVRLSE